MEAVAVARTVTSTGASATALVPVGRGLHSFTFQLNVSAFCVTRGV